MGEWRPIETAPKDGTTIDVWRDGTRETVYWGFRPHCCGEMGQHCDSDWHSETTPGWVCATFGEFVGGKHDPFTHWMPLPAPPPSPPIRSKAMTDRLFADCCYGSEGQHMVGTPCPSSQDHVRLCLAAMLDLAGYPEDAEHLRKAARVGDVLVPHPVAMAAMIHFAGLKEQSNG